MSWPTLFVVDYRRDGTVVGKQSATCNKEVNMLAIDAENDTQVFFAKEKVSVSRVLRVNPSSRKR